MPTSNTVTNGKVNGKAHGKPKDSRKSKPLFASAKMVTIFLIFLVVVTLFVDTYLLFSQDFRHDPKAPKPLPTTQKDPRHSPVRASVERPVTRRRFKFQDHNFELPKLKKVNRTLITEAPLRKNSKSQPKSNFDFRKQPILNVFEQAGIPPLNDTMIALLPTWDDIVKQIGPHPVVAGLETCDTFRKNVPAVERMLGSSGMFNTGTNLVTHLLKKNCQIPERVEKYGEKASKEAHGMRWQVPWGKHSPAKYKEEHATQKAKEINKEWIMPVVTIRSPYSWMHSMCKNGYTSRWIHGRKGRNCPNLVQDGQWNEVTTKFAEGRTEYSDSLAHLWNDWYKMYLEDAKYPRLIVRLEDLMFHAKETTTTICTCVGGKMRTDQPFQYVLDSAKADSRGHDTSTGFVQAWIKYSKPMPPWGGFSKADYRAAKEALNEDYMELFHYEHPPPGDYEENER